MQKLYKRYKLPLPGISFRYRYGRIIIHRSTFRELQNPDYFRFMLNPDKKILVIQRCEFDDPGYHRKPELKCNDHAFQMSSVDMVRMLYKVCHWDRDSTYRIWGSYLAKEDIVIFDLSKAEIVIWDKNVFGESDVDN